MELREIFPARSHSPSKQRETARDFAILIVTGVSSEEGLSLATAHENNLKSLCLRHSLLM